ncbi:S1 family peptidase [Paludisphaera mucosa]|uniref:Serine protease n=1 Tax=Paludisphaera mucosa TaxID=3030827 RepID=A0ABT6FGS3_9BACT|nr:serine protease [Paludisphaera mucosa]MDG3006765.1 serine protease [Paludisphaera mucosa]
MPGRLPAQAVRRRSAEASRVGAARATPSTRPAPAAKAPTRRDPLAPGDDDTFRPTVVIRRGTSQGTGTIIATASDQTLVLTAAHVVREPGSIVIELHRYNIGLEHARGGAWPLIVPAEVVGVDTAADVAILRLRDPSPLPFVARLFDGDSNDLRTDTLVTSLGVDLGARLSSWNTKIVETTRLQLEGEDVERPFLITLKIPEHGRSGGGLFTEQGRLVGVCVGHAEMVKDRRMGVFASIASVRRLIREHDLETLVDRSQARLAPRPAPAREDATPSPHGL